MMDCGAWTNNDKLPYVVRIRGCEFGLSGAEISELCAHLIAVRDGAKESISEDLKDLRILRRNEAKGIDLLKLIGIPKPQKQPAVQRRL